MPDEQREQEVRAIVDCKECGETLLLIGTIGATTYWRCKCSLYGTTNYGSERFVLAARVEELERERDHWKNCHDGQVATKRRLSRRYGELHADLERCQEALETLRAERAKWQRRCASRPGGTDFLVADGKQSGLFHAIQELERALSTESNQSAPSSSEDE